jgi:hypothetical protein
MHIAVPSKGRAGKIRTPDVLPSSVLYVPEQEVESYTRCHQKSKVVGVPHDVKGITATRNWILSNCGEDHVVMIDDDVRTHGYWLMRSESCKQITLTEEQWIVAFQQLFAMCYGLDFKIWGVATDGAPRSNYPFKPFMFYSYVTASCMGIINDGEFMFDERYTVKEDYEICLRHIRQKGGILAARYIYWQNEHWETKGGCRDYRTQEVEERCTKLLMAEYPRFIRRVERRGSEYCIQLDF